MTRAISSLPKGHLMESSKVYLGHTDTNLKLLSMKSPVKKRLDENKANSVTELGVKCAIHCHAYIYIIYSFA